MTNGEMNPLQFGRLMSKVESLEQGHERVEEEVHAIRVTLEKLVVAEASRTASDKTRRRFGDHTLLVFSGIVGGLVSLIAEFVKVGVGK